MADLEVRLSFLTETFERLHGSRVKFLANLEDDQFLKMWRSCTGCEAVISKEEPSLPYGYWDASTLLLVKSMDAVPQHGPKFSRLKHNALMSFLDRWKVKQDDYLIAGLYHCQLHGEELPNPVTGCQAFLRELIRRRPITRLIVCGLDVINAVTEFNYDVLTGPSQSGLTYVNVGERKLNLTVAPAYLSWRHLRS